MSDALTQYWRGASTVNVVWLVQTRLGGHDDFDCNWVTDSVWGDAVEAEKYLADISHRWPRYEKRVYGVPCYGEMAKFLGDNGWAEKFVDED